MIIKYFFWEIIFKLRRAPIFQKLICIWHSYNTTVIKWWSHNFKIYYLIISKLSKNIYNNNPKRLPKFEGCSLTHLKVMPTVPGHMPHPVYLFTFLLSNFLVHSSFEQKKSANEMPLGLWIGFRHIWPLLILPRIFIYP